MHPCTDAIVVADFDAIVDEPKMAPRSEVRLLKRTGRQVEVVPSPGHAFFILPGAHPYRLYCQKCGETKEL